MRVLVTGAGGLVGRSVVREALLAGHEVRAFELPGRVGRKNMRRLSRFAWKIERDQGKVRGGLFQVHWGSINNTAQVALALSGCQGVIHLAAIIPPASEANPELAEMVNVRGTENILTVLSETQEQPPVLVYASSIAIYGDRRGTPDIKVGDPIQPGTADVYALQKAQAEELVRKSGLDWRVLRLTFIASPEKLKRDPLMFEMPLDTNIEICHADDAGRAFVHALERDQCSRQVFNIAGGLECRTTYGAYLKRMFHYFGMDESRLKSEAFSKEDFHCGFMDTTESQKLLEYQRISLEDYYRMIARKTRFTRPWVRLVRGEVLREILAHSPYLTRSRKLAGQDQAGGR